MSYLQQSSGPLFPNIIWSRPETTHGAGKLLIIGGQAHEFIRVAESYSAAEKAGAGVIRVIMPESLRSITKMLPNIEYAPANNSGSLARSALAELLDAALWADGVLLAGDLGKNSETSLLLESFVNDFTGAITVSNDAIKSLPLNYRQLLVRQQTTYSLTLMELRTLGIDIGLEKPVTSSIGNVELASILEDISTKYAASLVVINGNQIWTSSAGQVALTNNATLKSPVELAAQAAVWTIQNPGKTFEAITTAAHCA